MHDTRVNGRTINLTRIENALLGALWQGIVLTRPMLLKAVWAADPTNVTRTVDMHMSRLRRKLGKTVKIRTVHGVGYRLVR